MSEAARLIDECTIELFMDYGQFIIHGGTGDEDTEPDLLDRAFAARPCAGDGASLLVLSPHQNNFEMSITVQVWDTRPPRDRADWQQVCEDRLRVGTEGTLSLSSPVDGWAEAAVPTGEYLIEVGGRGFLNYGWPGSATPGDMWRIRLWPDDGSDPLPAQQWDMPGYGVPKDVPIPEPVVAAESGEAQWQLELRREAAEHERAQWGGDPIPALVEYSAARDLARYDRPLAEAIATMDADLLRDLARHSAIRAYDHAGLSERPWVRPALSALRAGAALPPPFDDIDAAHDRLAQDEYGPRGEDEPGDREISVTRVSARQLPVNPYDYGDISRPHFAINTIFHALDSDPRQAAIAALNEAAITFGADVDLLFAALRTEFDLPAR
ncbi:hypothetical protein [Nocardia sp. NPDC050710]|uniref:hypothetical protein n=1 Tax=Nocardia sp. NPDC050710 TaxID=3157220 RepID=UPI00340903D3